MPDPHIRISYGVGSGALTRPEIIPAPAHHRLRMDTEYGPLDLASADLGQLEGGADVLPPESET